MQDAREVAQGLAEIAALLRVADESKFRIAAFERAAHTVAGLGERLGLLVEQDRLRDLDGIGPTLAREIAELWNQGESEYLGRLRRQQPQGAAQLIQVEGMTPQRIRAVTAALGVRSVEELRAACAAGAVRGLGGFGAKTERKLLEACERWLRRGEAPPDPLLLVDAVEVAASVVEELGKVPKQAYVAGAVRRGEETVGEIELVVVGELETALAQLAARQLVVGVDAAAGTARLPSGASLRLHAAREDLGNVLVRATGNAEHVRAVCERARQQGFALFAEGGGERVRAFASEADVYAALGLALVPPELRAGRDELEVAAHEDFGDLIGVGDLVGMVHCHTNYSDGADPIVAMAMAAHAMGMKYITITDHSASARYAGGLSLERLKQQWDEIAAAQEQVPIRILRGTESDILADGALDYPDSVLAELDVVIASIHLRHRMDRAAMTKRLGRALSLPVFKIWGHPLGRILNHRDPIDCDVEAVLDVLAGAHGAVEINADPRRLDLAPAWLPAARARGIPFVISTDAHSTAGLGVLPFGVTMARRGGIRKHEVLNTRSAEAFAAAVRPV